MRAVLTSRLTGGVALAVLALALSYIAVRGTDAVVASVLGVVGLLLPLRAASFRVMQNGLFSQRVLIVGAGPLAEKLIDEIEARPDGRDIIVGVVDDALAGDGLRLRYPIFGPLKQLDKIIEGIRPDRIIVALAERRGRLPVHQLLVAQVCDGVVVEDGVEAYERVTGKLAVEALTPSLLVFDRDFRKSRLALLPGRVMSLAVAVVGLVVLAPLMGLIALAVKLDSRGPVFYVHERVGLHGRRFKLIKFRTMRPLEGEASLWFLDNCDRVTRVGKWLRKFRLDELPQLLNVLRGEMNLVGPRPQRVQKFELLSLVARNTPERGDAIPYFSLRSRVRPGITGWAQVRYGYAHDLEEEIEKMRYDLYYIKHMSLWLDLRILVDTVRIILKGHGSAVFVRTAAQA